ncbi:MAG TPA: oligosaccharide flippase family protein [Thermoanaerobaculia bacterium]|nr:oligosaccharide flippase family protein [Thermoanaerobaculia bacterium]
MEIADLGRLSVTSVSRNVAFNFLGKSWAALMSLAFVPLYIRFLGIEAYGLLGFFSLLLVVLSVLDLGLGSTLNRELARHTARQDGPTNESRDLLRTLEVPYGIVGILLGVSVAALAPFLARHWVNAASLPVATVREAIILMGVVVAAQWPTTLYAGGLRGLQQQGLWNAISASAATLRGVGAALVLWKLSATILAFFTWQAAVSILQTLVTRWYLWRSLPGEVRPELRFDLLVRVWRFAAGMTAITLVSLFLAQLDRLVLSKLTSLKEFGYYTLASAVALGLYALITPVFEAFFPRLSQLVAVGDEPTLRSLYHRGCQLMAVLVLPVAAVVAFFSRDLILVWTGSSDLAARSHVLVTIMIAGTALNGLMNLPYALQLASGWTRLTFLTNVVALLFLAPLAVILAKRYGSFGVAWITVILNGGYLAFLPHIIHLRLLRGEKGRWYLWDVGIPLAIAVIVAAIGHAVLAPPATASRPLRLLLVSVVYAVTLGAVLGATPSLRQNALGWLARRRVRIA